ncbi:MAG: biopolymer transporter ExbD [Candidatus Glassbacteria bacterium]|nr:biopolymer transporter ExbD [Candidatus Glassbacteria bacterium]
MSFFRKTGHDELICDINVTSLVDVTLTLLIIFMISTPLFKGGIEVVLPKTQTAHRFSFTGLVVTISKDKGIFLDEEPVAKENLADRLQEIYLTSKNKAVYLRADEDIPYRDVTMVLGVIRHVGFESLGLVAEPMMVDQLRR